MNAHWIIFAATALAISGCTSHIVHPLLSENITLEECMAQDRSGFDRACKTAVLKLPPMPLRERTPHPDCVAPL